MTPIDARPVTYGLDPSTARFSVAQYYRMIELGILDDNDKVELLEGYIVLKASQVLPMTQTAARPVTYGLDASIARFSVARYQRMIEAGILDANDQVELLEGYVVLKMPRDPEHDGTIDLVKAALGGLLPAGWFLRVQQAITGIDSQPEPDIAIVRGGPRTYLSRHPGPTDIGLIVEIANSSLVRDRQDKARIYAGAGIAVYWIVNLVDRRIEVYTQPSGPTAAPAYAACQYFQPGDAVPLVLDGTALGPVPAADLLP